MYSSIDLGTKGIYLFDTKYLHIMTGTYIQRYYIIYEKGAIIRRYINALYKEYYAYPVNKNKNTVHLQSMSPVGIFPSATSFSEIQSKILSNVFVNLNRSLKL